MKITLLIIILNIFCHTAQSAVTHEQKVQIKTIYLNDLNNKFAAIKLKGEKEFISFKGWYFDTYFNPELRQRVRHFSLREIISHYNNQTAAPDLEYNKIFELVNTYLRFNSPDDTFTILIDRVSDEKIFYKSLVYYTIGVLAELQSARRKFIGQDTEFRNLQNIIVNSVTPYFEPGGAGKGSISDYEEAFFKFYVSLHSDFPINLTDDVFHAIQPRETESENDKITKSTFWMELASYCIKHCTQSKNFPGIQDSPTKDEAFYYLLKSSFQNGINKKSYSWYHFQDYNKRLLQLLDSRNDPYADVVRASISKRAAFSFITNIRSNFFTYADNQKMTTRLYMLVKYVLEQMTQFLIHYAVYISMKVNLPLMTAMFCLGLLGFSGSNPFRIKEIVIAPETQTKKGKLKTYILKLLKPIKLIQISTFLLLKKIIDNIISTYKSGESSLVYKISVQGILVSLTIYFSFIKDYLTTYYGAN